MKKLKVHFPTSMGRKLCTFLADSMTAVRLARKIEQVTCKPCLMRLAQDSATSRRLTQKQENILFGV